MRKGVVIMNNNEFRIICTKGDGNRWIKGEIYKYKNNTIKDFRGYEWGNFYDFNEIYLFFCKYLPIFAVFYWYLYGKEQIISRLYIWV